MNKLLGALAILGLAFSAEAQNQPYGETPPPAPPLVVQAAAGANWRIQVAYRDRKPGQPASGTPEISAREQLLPVLIEYRRLREFSQITLTRKDGERSEAYVQAGRVYLINSETGKVAVRPVQDQECATPVFTSGLPGTAWITLGDYRGIETLDGTACYKFYREPFLPTDADGTRLPALTAWIRVADKHPVRVDMDEVTYIFSKLADGSPEATLPAQVQEAMEKVNRELKALEWMARMGGKR